MNKNIIVSITNFKNTSLKCMINNLFKTFLDCNLLNDKKTLKTFDSGSFSVCPGPKT